jgi:hypothetical protein
MFAGWPKLLPTSIAHAPLKSGFGLAPIAIGTKQKSSVAVAAVIILRVMSIPPY